jgi:hypothetical protein
LIGDSESGKSIGDSTSSYLARIFSTFESHKDSLKIVEYSIGQTTLEQIFNQFAASQENPENKAQP